MVSNEDRQEQIVDKKLYLARSGDGQRERQENFF